LNDAATTGGNGSDDSDVSGSKPTGIVVRPVVSDGSTPTVSEGFARSMIARRSAAGQPGRDRLLGRAQLPDGDHGLENSMPFGSLMVANESCLTPRLRYARASRFALPSRPCPGRT
jgi:hypothetical protein